MNKYQLSKIKLNNEYHYLADTEFRNIFNSHLIEYEKEYSNYLNYLNNTKINLDNLSSTLKKINKIILDNINEGNLFKNENTLNIYKGEDFYD